MKLKYAHGIVPGNSDSEPKTECQDKIRIVDENGVAVIFLASPGGMTEPPGFYTELAAEAAAALMTERFDELFASEDDHIKEALLVKIREGLQGKGIELSGTDCALLFVAVKENRYLAGHMGGGLIARFNGSCSVLSNPENDLSRKRTYYSAEDYIMKNLRIYEGDLQEPIGFILMSEGACQSLYEYSTGNLSSACDTFFAWLKEYEEEQVSEALEENINKYFLKNMKGDISLVLTVSDNKDTGPDAESPGTSELSDAPETKGTAAETAIDDTANKSDTYAEAGKPVKESGKSRKIIKYLIALIIVLAVIFVLILKQQPGDADQKEAAREEPAPPVTYSANYEPSVTLSAENPKTYDAGEYQTGEDIPAGEYFFWNGEMLKPGSIAVNGDTCLSGELYCMTVRVKEGDTLASDIRFTSAENINPVKATDGILISGKYKIGKDIAPGTYTVSPVNKNTEGRYYSIFDEEISNDAEFSEDTTVEVPEEGYVVFYNSILAVD